MILWSCLPDYSFNIAIDMQMLNPQKFGLSSGTEIEQTDESTVTIILKRKSRLILADGKRIAEKVKKIKVELPETKVLLKTSAPVCGKTRDYLRWEGIEII